ncbi:hypothetical protein N658DRAFT_74479 [Parathielavia hyrcaniae]|uniref:Uncharacterized protein n=1 Tax=Parathielavia hyrcaniae TaxID=113614 RepID=A0AAN6SWZ3_9PEZI|nr:hypothetical protein N658DRAFT_74479 [Parathielavia hyrcaniae]
MPCALHAATVPRSNRTTRLQAGPPNCEDSISAYKMASMHPGACRSNNRHSLVSSISTSPNHTTQPSSLDSKIVDLQRNRHSTLDKAFPNGSCNVRVEASATGQRPQSWYGSVWWGNPHVVRRMTLCRVWEELNTHRASAPESIHSSTGPLSLGPTRQTSPGFLVLHYPWFPRFCPNCRQARCWLCLWLTLTGGNNSNML